MSAFAADRKRVFKVAMSTVEMHEPSPWFAHPTDVVELSSH